MSSRLEKKKPTGNKPESKKGSGASRLETGKQKEPGMLQLTVTLCGICAVCALLLGLTNMVTEPIIEEAAEAKKTADIAEKVLPGFTGTLTQVNYVGSDSTVRSIQKGSDGSFVVEVSPKSSYSGNLILLVGIDPNKAVAGISVSSSGETNGIGSKALEDDYLKAQYVGKSGPVELTKNGGEVEGITGATFTSTGVKDAVNSALEAIENTNDAPFDPSLVPDEPDPTDDIDVQSVEQSGDGYAVTVDCSTLGFPGATLVLRVNIDSNRAVTGIEVVESTQTDGIGSNALTEEYLQQFVGKSGSVEVDAVGGATFTSNAVNVGVNAALKAVESQG